MRWHALVAVVGLWLVSVGAEALVAESGQLVVGPSALGLWVLDPNSREAIEQPAPRSGRIFFDDTGFLWVSTLQGLWRLDPVTGAEVLLPTPVPSFLRAVIGDYGYQLAVGPALQRVDLRDGSLTTFPPSPLSSQETRDLVSRNMAATEDGRLFWLWERTGAAFNSRIFEIDLGTGAITKLISGRPLNRPTWIAADGNRLLLVDTEAHAILALDPDTLTVDTLVALPKVRPRTVARRADGLLFISDGSGKIYSYDERRGVLRLLQAHLPGAVAIVPGPPLPPACRNGIDDDGDRRVDSRDPGCESSEDGREEAPCEDGIDNDGDGLIDFEQDPGCESGAGTALEAPQCDDGIDNDGDGYTDHPNDPACVGPSDNTEHFLPEPLRGDGPRCGLLGIELAPLLPWAVWRRRRWGRDC